ncbi:FAD-dependent thymidylate synthase [Candidatus Woesearchaeota archaeon]|nr:FAD-dependent thymidylate synthase [Candidatus Woesearchaeota archaeon]
MPKYNSMNEVPGYIKEKLKKFITNVGGETFVIVGLPSELTGGCLARYSRAPTGMQLTLVNEFLDENGDPSQQKGSELMDRVLNAFGDESVGELEGAHVGIENISQLATKGLEDRRIGGSPIEQSTRYVKYDVKDEQGRWRYLRPKEIIESGLIERFEKVNDRAFEIYSKGIKLLIDYFKKEFPRSKQTIDVIRDGKTVKVHEEELKNEDEENAFNNAYNFTVRCAALDVGRCVLPSSTLTHLGIFGNGRFFTNVINYLKSSELLEEKERGKDLETELNKVIPTFIKRNKANPKINETNRRMRKLSYELFSSIKPEDKRVTLITRMDYFDTIVATSLFPYTNISLMQTLSEVQKMPVDKKLDILNSYIGKRESRRDRTGRSLEANYPLTFDLVGCFAEYRDLERHRMLTQQRQLLTPDLGFIMPPEMGIVGLEKEVEELVEMMDDLNSDLRHASLEIQAQYATLFNHRLRFMLGMNLREFQHLSELRTQPAGHFSYRSMVMEMADKVKATYPWASKAFEFVDYSDPNNKISRAKEQSKIAGKNLAKGIEGGIDL